MTKRKKPEKPESQEHESYHESMLAVRPIVTSELSNEKLFSDFEKQNFSALIRQNDNPLLLKIVRRVIPTFLVFLVLLIAAYYSSKYFNVKHEILYSDATSLDITTPHIVMPNVFDTTVSLFPDTDDYASRSVLVFDLTANQPIYVKNGDTKTSIASLTKLASIHILSKSENMEKIVEIDEDAEKIEGAAVHFKKGERYTVADMIRAAIIASSNQAAFIINKPDDTVNKMNNLASALHLDNTRFANPAGFDDDGNYSSALEYVQIAKLFFQDQTLKKIAGEPRAEITELVENKTVKISNTNDLTRLGTKYLVAGKTGTTPKAGQNLLLLLEKNDRQYLVILLNGIDRYKDAYKVIDRLP